MKNPQRVLIADADTQLVDTLSGQCRSLGLRVEIAGDGESVIWLMDEVHPDLVILDASMKLQSGLAVREQLASDVDLRVIPLLLLTQAHDGHSIDRGDATLGYTVPKGTHMWSQIEPLIIDLLDLYQRQGKSTPVTAEPDPPPGRSVEQRGLPVSEISTPNIRSEHIDAVFSALGWDEPLPDDSPGGPQTELLMTRPWVLCVDDDPGYAAVLKMRLQRHGVDVLQAFAGTAGYRYAFTSEAQAIILDYELPDGNGDYVLRRLKENPITQDIPVIVLTGKHDRALERKMYNLGAVRFFTKPIAWEDLWCELKKHIRLRPHLAGV